MTRHRRRVTENKSKSIVDSGESNTGSVHHFEKMKDKRVDSKDEKSDNKNINNRRRLLKYDELPDYLRENRFILDYYRSEWPLKDAFFSVFSWHNETLNIWTHLFGFYIFATLTVMSTMDATQTGVVSGGLLAKFSRQRALMVSEMLLPMTIMKGMNVSDNSNMINARHPELIPEMRADGAEAIPAWPWFVFLYGAMGCLLFSATSHIFACHSRRFHRFFWRLDYTGIALMIVSSFIAPTYYSFMCNPYARIIYLTSISAIGIFAVIALFSTPLSTPAYRHFRAYLFLAMGFSGVVPTFHSLNLYWGYSHVLVALGYELAMGMFYTIGAVFYVARMPERWKPGAFDIAGSSHQIFHVFVVLGALAHSVATLVILDFRQGSSKC